MIYEIRVEGHLDDAWASAFAGMAIARLAGGETSIRGPVPDQAALYALLRNVRDLGLTLVSVLQVTRRPARRRASTRRRPRDVGLPDHGISARSPQPAKPGAQADVARR